MEKCGECGRPLDSHEESGSFGERVADFVARIGRSWAFVGLVATAMAVWIALNRGPDAFDPYPFILLNLWISILTSFQGPIIMMSQDRLAARDRRRDEEDHEVNLRVAARVDEIGTKLGRLLETVDSTDPMGRPGR